MPSMSVSTLMRGGMVFLVSPLERNQGGQCARQGHPAAGLGRVVAAVQQTETGEGGERGCQRHEAVFAAPRAAQAAQQVTPLAQLVGEALAFSVIFWFGQRDKTKRQKEKHTHDVGDDGI